MRRIDLFACVLAALIGCGRDVDPPKYPTAPFNVPTFAGCNDPDEISRWVTGETKTLTARITSPKGCVLDGQSLTIEWDGDRWIGATTGRIDEAIAFSMSLRKDGMWEASLRCNGVSTPTTSRNWQCDPFAVQFSVPTPFGGCDNVSIVVTR